ncbi:NAD-dependent epimerase/dehydratase family protein [Fulvivirgaceae bacterium PWU4]|uniref:NAD-dependent epimerase/dehydratase family protein n=1 Tax=Chryseosolibacter histidini TaxID=2782349 RepID=A0AAP2DVN2_9BACT|nr:NAD-dependent epimerase/dehydratase family protein [Chryseosolibacter histidini]MBT1701579.1 NAD-dependent epimerase/dehydratase family protein [Chryseosolibacter histidini]
MIAVTGANGLLGSFIVRKLLAQGEPFIALKRKNSDVSLLADVQSSIQWKDADILDPVSMGEALENVSEVIHAAAMVSFNPRDARKIFRVNVEGTRNVVNACLIGQVKKLVYISSVAALGRLKGQSEIDEGQKWTDNPLNSTYAESKYLAELEVFRAHEEGLNTVIVNPSVILAGADWNKSSAKLFKYVWDERPFYVDSFLNYVDVRDVADATYRLLRADHRGERFILNAGAIALPEFLSKMAVRFSKKPPAMRLNKTVLRLVAAGESVRSWLSRSEPLITRETARFAGTRFLYRNEKIKKQLNFEFQTIDQTLEWCCEYYMKQAKR